jgi:hypothetical protein
MPLEQTLRELSSIEQRALRQRFSEEQRRLNAGSKRISVFGLIVFGTFWGLTMLAARGRHGFVVTVFCSVHWAHLALGILELKARDKRGPAPPPERVT